MRLNVNANKKADRFLYSVLDIAYICVAMANGANHHFPTGSNAQLRSAPERNERTMLTKIPHQPSALIMRSTLAPSAYRSLYW